MKEQNYIKLSELTSLIKDAMKLRFGEQTFWVLAEVSGHKFYTNPERHYFEFLEKEEQDKSPIAKVKAIAWTNGSERIRIFERETYQQFGNGMQVLAQVKIEFNAAYGFQLIVLDVDPNYTIGKVEQQRRDTLLRLVKENPGKIIKLDEEYVTFNKQQSLPLVISRMALIGSPNSEGFSDFCHTLQTNAYQYHFKLDVYQSAVQGVGADAEIKQKLLQVYESSISYDVVIIIRGGGSKSDLLTFDAYGLAQAVARFPVPIITGLGHHNDISITDLMAHTATKTPTKAAEFILAHNRKFEDNILQLQGRIIIKSQRLVYAQQQKIADIKESLVNLVQGILSQNALSLQALKSKIQLKPIAKIHQKEGEIDYLRRALKSNIENLLRRQASDLTHFNSLIKVMSLDNILKRGFAYLEVKGKIVTDVRLLNEKEELTIVTDKHNIKTKILKIDEN